MPAEQPHQSPSERQLFDAIAGAQTQTPGQTAGKDSQQQPGRLRLATKTGDHAFIFSGRVPRAFAQEHRVAAGEQGGAQIVGPRLDATIDMAQSAGCDGDFHERLALEMPSRESSQTRNRVV